ncbi:hypothetical protein BDV95DRAFT_39821 [Massariosphaeria phaeospora]|uniref:Uncharacterized protein n=1 Tax=Massariosphaeria phaeospora TaxID=100035 RepID=A0A7C8I5K1_9PLEO|nr:hypothetical protein BDV95DRAFT_39821 [Massariosphaeria phaeospora]
MLQSLAQHCGFGKTDKKDCIGVLSSHPFTICAVLRAFGRGIETMPTRRQWTTGPTLSMHAFIPLERRRSLMQSCPVTYVRAAAEHTELLAANTMFYVDHAEPEWARESVEKRVGKVLSMPWSWTFGDLRDGYEYLCVVES